MLSILHTKEGHRWPRKKTARGGRQRVPFSLESVVAWRYMHSWAGRLARHESVRAVGVPVWDWFQTRIASKHFRELNVTLAAGTALGHSRSDLFQRLEAAFSNSGSPAAQEAVSAGRVFSRQLSDFHTSKLHQMGYQLVYGSAFAELRDLPIRLLEIGIGTNRPNAISGMGASYQPGTSLRAWRAYFPRGDIYGADIDESTIFQEKGIQTFVTDQRSLASLGHLRTQLSDPLDVIIDDGLHTPEANSKTLRALLPALAPGGLYVIEDILGARYDSLWKSFVRQLPPPFRAIYISSPELNQFREAQRDAALLVIQRLGGRASSRG
jgi:hypothetical protein